MRKLVIFLCALAVFSCKNESNKNKIDSPKNKAITLKYAKGFSVELFDNYKLLTISNPWPKSEKVFKYALITNTESDQDWMTDEQDLTDAFPIPLDKIVVTSTTHIPALELLDVETTLVGFPGCDYVSSEKTRLRIDAGEVRELGKNEGINTEVLLELQPDLVIGFGVDGTSKSLDNIKTSGIPVIYNGDWVEASALAKAEWIKFFGVLFNKEKEADSIFNAIESNYLKAKAVAHQATNKPTILSGAMHKDIWYLPIGSSPEAQFLKDANIDYLWEDTSGSGSLALSFETVFEKAQHADIWLSPSYYTSFEQLEKANPHYTKFDAFKNKSVYTFANTTGKTGGVLYYELGFARPDLVLKDIIKICHPNLLSDYKPYFFKPLE